MMIGINRWARIKLTIFAMVIAVSFMACDIWDDDDEEEVVPEKNNPTALNGAWTGQFGTGDTSIAFITKDGEIFAADADGGIYVGSYEYYEPSGRFAATIENSGGTMTIDGTGSALDRIDSTYTTTAGGSGNMTLEFDDNYNKPSSFDLLSGQWSTDQSDYVIDADGGITGTYLSNCNLSGSFSIIDPAHNLYILDADLTGCDMAGQYHGVASLHDVDAGQNGKFVAILTDDQKSWILSVVGERQ